MKKGQSEMIGFSLILIIVAVLILVFISVSMKDKNLDFVESYEVESFIQSFLDQTTNCADGYEPNYASLRKTMTKCISKSTCANKVDPCKEFNETITKIINNSWKIQPGSVTKGYVLNITVKGEEFFSLSKGNKTDTSIGSIQKFDGATDIIFQIYN